MSQNRCVLRKSRVSATPEEGVRQSLLQYLVSSLGYPSSLIVIEKKISELPHIRAQKIPHRRIDVLVYSSQGIPLLLIECKASKISTSSIRQVFAYNRFVNALAVAVVAAEKEICFLPGEQKDKIPSWSELCEIYNRSLA